MAYIDLATTKTYLGVAGKGDDALITACINRAIATFDRQFSHQFEAETETRYFRPTDVYHGILWLDKPLLTVTTLTNGDDDATVISSADYWLLPRNESPYWYIRLKSGGTTTFFEFGTDGEISVAGTWGYTGTAPNDVVQAVLRLSAYYYRQKDSQVFETTAVPEMGIMTIPMGIPKDVMSIIETLRTRYDLA